MEPAKEEGLGVELPDEARGEGASEGGIEGDSGDAAASDARSPAGPLEAFAHRSRSRRCDKDASEP